jgi:Domain of unknown function (DUF397)
MSSTRQRWSSKICTTKLRPDMAAMGNEWQRASACGSESCIEVRRSLPWMPFPMLEIRDSEGTCMRATSDEFAAFVAGVKAGEFDQFLPEADPGAGARR